MVTIWFIAISLRIRSLALTPIASERLRTVIGGSISTCVFRAAAAAARWPPRFFLLPERVRRTSSSSTSRAEAGTGEVTRRSPARSLRRARRPARSAAEPRRPAFVSAVFFLLGRRRRRRRRRREPGPAGRRAARQAATGAEPPARGGPRAGHRARCGRAGPAAGAGRRPPAGCRVARADRTASRPASRPWSSTSRDAGSWAPGPVPPGAAGRPGAAVTWARPPGARARALRGPRRSHAGRRRLLPGCGAAAPGRGR